MNFDQWYHEGYNLRYEVWLKINHPEQLSFRAGSLNLATYIKNNRDDEITKQLGSE